MALPHSQGRSLLNTVPRCRPFICDHAPSAQDEAAWECFCAQSLEGQDRQSPGELPNFDTPATLRRQLGLRSFRALYQVRWRVQASVLA